MELQEGPLQGTHDGPAHRQQISLCHHEDGGSHSALGCKHKTVGRMYTAQCLVTTGAEVHPEGQFGGLHTWAGTSCVTQTGCSELRATTYQSGCRHDHPV
jgi:hypothetical protein